VVTGADWLLGRGTARGYGLGEAAAVIACQVAGAIAGAALADAMFGMPALAGSQPASHVNPAVVAAMAEIGVDISAEIPKPLGDSQAQDADIVITMGCGDACPVYPGKRYLDWELPDPAGLTVEQVRPIRDEIARRVAGLPAELAGPGDKG
jgi:protein-tyrosine-phosphatase